MNKCSKSRQIRETRSSSITTQTIVNAELSFEHVGQPDLIQSLDWTRVSVQLSSLNKSFCSNPRNLYVTSSISSDSSCSTRGLSWRICFTRGSNLNLCPKPNSTIRLTQTILSIEMKEKETNLSKCISSQNVVTIIKSVQSWVFIRRFCRFEKFGNS